VFPHVTRAMQGVIFKNHEIVKELIETTRTQNGLAVKANIFDCAFCLMISLGGGIMSISFNMADIEFT
jgi:hypothetical protein